MLRLISLAEARSRELSAALLAAILLIHLGNVLVPAVHVDEASHVNVSATLATLGEYGNTWQFGHLITPDRIASTGPPVIFQAALAWKLGIRGPVGIRLAVMTPFFAGFLFLFRRLLSDFDWETQLLTLALFLGIPGWGLFSARVLGEFPALFFLCLGAVCMLEQRFQLGGLAWGFAAASKVLFHPRNFPLHLASLNDYVPLVLVVLAFVFGWMERRSSPKLFFFCCLSSFWCVWHLVGFRGWLRYALPGLILLMPPLAAALRSIRRQQLPWYIKLSFFATVTAFIFLGLYDNTYSIWTQYKAWRGQSQVVRYVQAHRGRRFLAEGLFSPYPDYLWLTGCRFQELRTVRPSTGDIVVLREGNSFLRREMETNTIGNWRFVFATPEVDVYERR
ncbi:MAG: hypothetical protein HY236_10025 [Acidobacteria bacterium]|nr:hypothetical protein [Acidobacteriota bacterium]